jgi:hypothetical protein
MSYGWSGSVIHIVAHLPAVDRLGRSLDTCIHELRFGHVPCRNSAYPNVLTVALIVFPSVSNSLAWSCYNRWLPLACHISPKTYYGSPRIFPRSLHSSRAPLQSCRAPWSCIDWPTDPFFVISLLPDRYIFPAAQQNIYGPRRCWAPLQNNEESSAIESKWRIINYYFEFMALHHIYDIILFFVYL